MDELKPCPFCGGEASLYVDDGVCVMCVKCTAKTKILIDSYNGIRVSGNAVKSVIEAWNRRVNDAV